MKVIFIITLLIGYLSISCQSIYAQGVSISIQPATIIFDLIDNQESLTKTIKIKNNSPREISLNMAFIPVAADKNKDGKISFDIDAKNKIFTETKNDLQLQLGGEQISNMTLKPLESREVNIFYQNNSVSDKDVAYTLLFTENEAGSEYLESGVSIKPSIGSVVILKFGNPGKSELNIMDFEASKTFYRKGPVSFLGVINNHSNHSSLLQPEIRIYNMLNQEVGKLKLNEFNILPQSGRKIETLGSKSDLEWKENFMLGIYRIELSVPLENGEELDKSTFFIALPTIPLIIICALLFVIGSVWLRVIKLR